MGCINSESTKDRKGRGSKTLNRDSVGNPLDDVEAARRRDKKESENKSSKEAEEVSKQNKELNKQIEKLKKENDIKKKQSKDFEAQKEKQIKMLEQEKNKEIEKLRKELEKQKQKKESAARVGKVEEKSNGKQPKEVGLTSLEDNKSLCQQCFYKLPRYTATNPSMSQCMNCRGYGLVMERFPYGANPSCQKALCFKKGWDKVKSLRLCSICNGRGGHESRVIPARRY